MIIRSNMDKVEKEKVKIHKLEIEPIKKPKINKIDIEPIKPVKCHHFRFEGLKIIRVVKK